MLNQIRQKIECLWLDNNRHRSVTQLAAIYVENMIFEQIEQFSDPRPTSLTANPSIPPTEENKRQSKGQAEGFLKRCRKSCGMT